MKIQLIINFFLSAKSLKAKEKVLNKIKSHIRQNIDQSFLNEIDSKLYLVIQPDSWEQAIYEILKLCQSMGRQWTVTGDINFEFNACTHHSKVVGVEFIDITAENKIYS
jgi:hypothetical protein